MPEVAEVGGKSPPPPAPPPVDKVVVARKHPGVFMETSELVEETGVQGGNAIDILFRPSNPSKSYLVF